MGLFIIDLLDGDKMNSNFEKLKELLNKKKSNIQTNDDVENIELIESLFELGPTCFFKVDQTAAIGILYYLGIPDEEIESVYFDLISPENYKNNATKIRYTLNEKQFDKK